MKKYTPSTSEWYSIIAAILMIGFLLILTVSTLNLVLQELQDGRWRENYMKAYAGAEWAMELALLKIKQNGYGFYEEKRDIEYFWLARKSGVMSYDIESEASSYLWTLDPYATDIIPLFTLIDDSGDKISIQTIDFDDTNSLGLIWNVIGDSGGLSGVGDFNESTSLGLRTLSAGNSFLFQNTPVSGLFSNQGAYLTVFNPTDTTGEYTVSSQELFTRPKAIIKSTAQVWKYSQNIDTTVDNSEFLWILKYSIYSWD